MKKGKRLLGIAAAGLIGAGSLFSGAAVTGVLQQVEVFAATDVAINATNFPDENFRGVVLDYIDSDKNKKLSSSEINKVTSWPTDEISHSYRINDYRVSKIKDWKGLEYFTTLEGFTGTVSGLNRLNDSVLGKLKSVSLTYNNSAMKKTDLSKCKNLETLYLDSVGEINIDSTIAAKIKTLRISNYSGGTKIDLSNFKNLEEFTGLGNYENTCNSLNLSNNTKLTSLTLRGFVNLTTLDVTKNTNLKKLVLSGCYKLTSLKIGTNKSWEKVHVDHCPVKNFDLKGTSNLTEVGITNTGITSLNMGSNKKLSSFWLGTENSNLKTLDISGLTGLKGINYGIGCEKLIMSKGQSIRDYDNVYGKWSSANSTVVSINKTGDVIKAENKGTAVITATNGKKITVEVIDKTAPAKKNGWKNENGGWKYYKDGKAYTGWHKMGKAEGEKTEHWSYFGKDGRLYTGWKNMGKNEGEKTAHWSYFGDNGWLRTGWQSMGKGTKNPDGNAAKHVSYFGDNGWLRTGWQQMGKGTKNPDGNAAKHVSYFGDNGWLRTGWQQMGKGTKNPDGNTAKHWSYFGSNGWLRTGMVTLGKADGEKITHKSYFGNNGWLVTNKRFSVAGKAYTADSRGWVK